MAFSKRKFHNIVSKGFFSYLHEYMHDYVSVCVSLFVCFLILYTDKCYCFSREYVIINLQSLGMSLPTYTMRVFASFVYAVGYKYCSVSVAGTQWRRPDGG